MSISIAPAVDLEAVPLLLQRTPHWVLWRNVRLLNPARVSDPATWADFTSATDALAEGRCSGLGFVLHRPSEMPVDQPGLVVLVLHHCRDPITGRNMPAGFSVVGRRVVVRDSRGHYLRRDISDRVVLGWRVSTKSMYSAVRFPGRIPGRLPPYFLRFSAVSSGLNTTEV